MLKNKPKWRWLLPITLLVCSGIVNAQQDVGEIRGLKRFDPASTLGMESEKDIKSVRLGHNVKNAAAQLQSIGGKIHYISGGSRSRNVKISFYQPYQDTSLEQQLKLDFNKDNGFIHHISVRFKLKSAYLDMQPVYDKIIENTVRKYGEPLTMSAVHAASGQTQNDVLVENYLKGIDINNDVSESVQQFFQQKIISSRARFTESVQGRAILLSGFNECYLWPSTGFTEIFSLCALRKSKVNMKGQAVEMRLSNFSIEHSIDNYRANSGDQLDINL